MAKILRPAWLSLASLLVLPPLLLIIVASGFEAPDADFLLDIQPPNGVNVLPSIVRYPDRVAVKIQLTPQTVDALVRAVNDKRRGRPPQSASTLQASIAWDDPTVRIILPAKVSLADPVWVFHIRPSMPRGFRLEFAVRVIGTAVQKYGSVAFSSGVDPLGIILMVLAGLVGGTGLAYELVKNVLIPRWQGGKNGKPSNGGPPVADPHPANTT